MSYNQIHIEKIDHSSIEDLQKIGKETFFETFTEGSLKEDMRKYLDDKFSEKQLIKELMSNDSEFFFAKVNEEIVGYLKLNYKQAQTEIKDKEGIEIERIYVLRKHQGKKIGQILYEKALLCAKERKAEFIWLGVWENNPRAIRFYQKNGFVAFDKHVFVLGDDHQTDILMKVSFN